MTLPYRSFGADEMPWSPRQLLGPPDAPRPGDIPANWCPSDQSVSWILLVYAHPVMVSGLEIHETNVPGAITAVSFFDPGGVEVKVWERAAPYTYGNSNILLLKFESSTASVKSSDLE